MGHEFIFPDLGEGISEGELVRWLVQEGDQVREDQEVAEVETDKALVTIPSPRAGKVEKLCFKEGDRIPVGAVLMTFSDDGSVEKSETPEKSSESKLAEPEKQAPAPKASEKKQESQPADRQKSEKVEGPKQAGTSSTEKSTATPTPLPKTGGGKLPPLATPYTRRLARELGVSLDQVQGSGPEGRITEADVQAAAQSTQGRGVAAPIPGPGAPSSDIRDMEKYGPVERVPLKSIRRKISEQMLTTWHQTVMVTHMDEAEVGELLKIKKEKAEFAKKRGVKLTLLPFLMKACVIALKDYPALNASLVNEEIVYKKYYHFGFAVDTEAGLMVPVIRDVDKKSILHLANELIDLSEKARERKIQMEALQGHSFSITNIGSIGGKAFTPIIHYPDSAILGLGRTYEKPIVVSGQIVAAPVLPLCLTFDHRVTDGATAARFVNQVIQYLKDPDLLLLEDGEE